MYIYSNIHGVFTSCGDTGYWVDLFDKHLSGLCAHYAGSLGATNQRYGLTWTMLSRGCPTQFHYHSGMEFTFGKKTFFMASEVKEKNSE